MVLFRIICFLQFLITAFSSISSLISFFREERFYFFMECIFFLLMSWISIFAISLVGTNYPDRPVAGKQKTTFNWLFLINFFLVAFLFGLFFFELKQARLVASILGTNLFSLPFSFQIPVIVSFVMVLFHLIVLYGLFGLRRLLYANFNRNKKFEFEQ
jgi:hypothetical protein